MKMSEAKKKASAELAAKNLAQLQKIDIAASKILDKMPFTTIYTIDPATKTWNNKQIEGTLFIYQRADRPYFSFLIANRSDPSDFIEPLTMNHVLEENGNFILFNRPEVAIRALWFHHMEDKTRAFNLLKKLVDKLKSSTTEQARAAAAAAAKASAPVAASAPAVPATNAAPSTSSKKLDLLQMIKVAQQSSTPAQGSSAAPISAQLPPFLSNLIAPATEKPSDQGDPPVNTMPVLLQKLMVQEQSRSLLKEPGTAMSADELEKDLLKTAKPRLLQDIANSPSAISLAAISTKSVHGSEGDGEADVADGEVLDPLEASFVVGSGATTPVLNKQQFISAISHLMQTDDEFVSQIHQAYVDALNRRLNI
ncbi:unnamed protein product [Caenorhabditis sp. 36 PRJEB53466]|nr:unnamed protein product [Caenorhabditis sp. 36 PRJEB53466]